MVDIRICNYRSAWITRRFSNFVYTFHNEKQNKDVYMVALRNAGKLIRHYEKCEYRNTEKIKIYDIW